MLSELEQVVLPIEGRFSQYDFHVSPAASQECPRFAADHGDPDGGQLSSEFPRVLAAHSAR
jgi:hypothetical protein